MKITRTVAVIVGCVLPLATGAMLAGAVLSFRATTLTHVTVTGNTAQHWASTYSPGAVVAVAGLCAVAWIVTVVLAACIAKGFWNDRKAPETNGGES